MTIQDTPSPSARDARDHATELAVVIPMYREAARIVPTLEDAIATLRDGPRDAELILVDDGSTDATADAVRPFLTDTPRGRLRSVTLLRQPTNKGKGAAVRRGLGETRAPWRLIMDADNSTRVGEVEKLFAATHAPVPGPRVGIVAGSRAAAESLVVARLHRKLAGRAFRLALSAIGVGLLNDTQCGFKLYRGEVADLAARLGREDRFAFDIEHLLLARRLGTRLVEVGVAWEHRDGGTVSVFRDGLTMLRSAVRIRRRVGRLAETEFRVIAPEGRRRPAASVPRPREPEVVVRPVDITGVQPARSAER